jgi:hypothetical protein
MIALFYAGTDRQTDDAGGWVWGRELYLAPPTGG